MGSMFCNEIGLAGEFRVMSELLLRGHNPAKSYLEAGPDVILENGLRIEVKSAHRYHQCWKGGRGQRKTICLPCGIVRESDPKVPSPLIL